MSQDETKRQELERQLRLANIRMVLLLDQAGLFSSPLPNSMRMQLCSEYRKLK